MQDFFERHEQTMLSRFEEAASVAHSGDRGENREQILADFLREHLPKKYGVIKGEVLTRDGIRSRAIDLIIYDKLHCPVLYSGATAVIPIEGVYGVIEVKSRLSKEAFLEDAAKVESFKNLAPRDLFVMEPTPATFVPTRPSRPFGVIFAFSLAGNSLHSLHQNFIKWSSPQRGNTRYVNGLVNLVCVLGEGLLYIARIEPESAKTVPLLDTDELVGLVERAQEKSQDAFITMIMEPIGISTFGRFFTYLLMMLSRITVGPPDLAQYLNLDLPPVIHRR